MSIELHPPGTTEMSATPHLHIFGVSKTRWSVYHIQGAFNTISDDVDVRLVHHLQKKLNSPQKGKVENMGFYNCIYYVLKQINHGPSNALLIPFFPHKVFISCPYEILFAFPSYVMMMNGEQSCDAVYKKDHDSVTCHVLDCIQRSDMSPRKYVLDAYMKKEIDSTIYSKALMIAQNPYFNSRGKMLVPQVPDIYPLLQFLHMVLGEDLHMFLSAMKRYVFPKIRKDRCVILCGPSNTGKSCVLDCVRSFFSNPVTLPCDGKFSLYPLLHGTDVCQDEFDFLNLTRSDLLLLMESCVEVCIPVKHKTPAYFYWSGHCIFTCNFIPISLLEDDAFYNRVDIFQFEKVAQGVIDNYDFKPYSDSFHTYLYYY